MDEQTRKIAAEAGVRLAEPRAARGETPGREAAIEDRQQSSTQERGAIIREAWQKRRDKLAAALPAGHKRCPACGQIKPVEDFHRDKYAWDGRKSACADCCHERVKVIRGIRKNRAAGAVPVGTTAVSTPPPSPIPPPVRVEPREIVERFGEAWIIKNDHAEALTLTVDFIGCPEVLDDIRRIAADEDRTPEAQVRYWLRKHLLKQLEMETQPDSGGPR
jgi:hypothetical protein